MKKGKRIKRVFPRKYTAGYITVSSGLAQDLSVKETWFTFGSRQKAARTYEPIPVTKNPELRVINREGKVELGILHSLYQSERCQKPQPWHKARVVENTDEYELSIWFSGDSYILVKEVKNEPRKALRSIIYKGRGRLNQVLENRRIVWKEKISLGTSPPSTDT